MGDMNIFVPRMRASISRVAHHDQHSNRLVIHHPLAPLKAHVGSTLQSRVERLGVLEGEGGRGTGLFDGAGSEWYLGRLHRCLYSSECA